MWIISEFQRRQISVFRPCQRLWLVSLRGASQVGRRRGTFGSSVGLKMTPEQTNLILRKIMLDSKHFHIYTAHCTLKTFKHYTHTVHKYTRKWTLHSAYLMKTPYTLYTAQYSVDADPSFVKFHCSITFDTALTFHKKNPHLPESVIRIVLISIRCWQGVEEDLSHSVIKIILISNRCWQGLAEDLSHSVIKIILISNRCCSAGKAWRRMT